MSRSRARAVHCVTLREKLKYKRLEERRLQEFSQALARCFHIRHFCRVDVSCDCFSKLTAASRLSAKRNPVPEIQILCINDLSEVNELKSQNLNQVFANSSPEAG